MRVYIYDPVDGVVSMRWDGTDRRGHVKVTGFTDPLQGPTARPGPANEVILSPDGDQAFADVDNKLYLVSVPVAGGATPSISISNPAAAPVPVRRLSRVGGDFLGWTNDGKSIYWSLGHSYFTYDLATASTRDRGFDAKSRQPHARGREARHVGRGEAACLCADAA